MTDWTERISFDLKSKLVVVNAGKVEIGQHVHSAFCRIVSDILTIDMEHIVVAPVSTATSFDDGLTAGSLSMQSTGVEIRKAAEILRAALIEQAALLLKVDESTILFDREHLEFGSSGRVCSVFELPLTLNSPVSMRDDLDTRPSIARSIQGCRTFIQDLYMPDMLHARALRGRDAGQVNVGGVRIVQDGGFAALVSESEMAVDQAWASLGEGRSKRDTTCDGPVNGWIENRQVITQRSGDTSCINGGISQSATRPFLAHASIAPSCAIAHFKDGMLEVWTHSQGVFQLRDAIAQQLRMEADHVTVRHVPSAGCYGHNGADDAAMDAVLVALQNEGSRIRLVWSRADEFQYSPVGAPMKVNIEANLSEGGSITNWRHTIWSGPHGQRPSGSGNVNLLGAIERDPGLAPNEVHDLPAAIGGGAARNAEPPYRIESFGITTHIVQDLPIRSSAIRGLGTQMNVVAIETALDALANQRAVDPIAFRLNHISEPRGAEVLRQLQSALDAAALPLGDGEAIGIGYSRYKNSAAFAAVAARVRLDKEVELLDVWAMIDAGHIVDMSGALNQIEGGIIQAASWTLIEGAMLRDGCLDVEGWDDYPILGWSDVPEIHAEFVGADTDLPSLGVGECMVGPVSAAIVNAVGQIAGVSIADLPLTRERIVSSLADG